MLFYIGGWGDGNKELIKLRGEQILLVCFRAARLNLGNAERGGNKSVLKV